MIIQYFKFLIFHILVISTYLVFLNAVFLSGRSDHKIASVCFPSARAHISSSSTRSDYPDICYLFARIFTRHL